MNKIFNQIFLYLCVALFCASCNNDGDTVYVDGMAPSELIATSSDVKLDISQRAKVVLQLAWKNPTLLSSDVNNPVTGDLLKTYVEASASRTSPMQHQQLSPRSLRHILVPNLTLLPRVLASMSTQPDSSTSASSRCRATIWSHSTAMFAP